MDVEASPLVTFDLSCPAIGYKWKENNEENPNFYQVLQDISPWGECAKACEMHERCAFWTYHNESDCRMWTQLACSYLVIEEDNNNHTMMGTKECGITCPSPSSIENGNISGETYTYGYLITHSCDSGYKLEGTADRECQIDGSWSGDVPKCSRITCPAPGNFNNGEISGTTHKYGDEITYSCNSGYTLKGITNSMCQSDGLWSNVAPECLRTCTFSNKPDTIYSSANGDSWTNDDGTTEVYVGTTVNVACVGDLYTLTTFTGDSVECENGGPLTLPYCYDNCAILYEWRVDNGGDVWYMNENLYEDLTENPQDKFGNAISNDDIESYKLHEGCQLKFWKHQSNSNTGYTVSWESNDRKEIETYRDEISAVECSCEDY